MIDLVDKSYIKSKGKYSDKELLEFLRKFEKEYGKVPTAKDFDNSPEYPSSTTYQKRFGSWNKALKAAGLDNNITTGLTDEELLKFLKKFYEEHGKPPKDKDFRNDSKYPNAVNYYRRFGSWNRALDLVGLLDKRDFSKYSDKDLLEFPKRFYEEYRRPPTENDFNDNHPKYPNSDTYIRHFGSWQKALKLVGLDIDSMVRKGIIDKYDYRARLSEILVFEHFVEKATDLSGENRNSPFDGICPKGELYDVKSSSLINNKFFGFKHLRVVDYHFLLAFDKDYKVLMYAWRIHGDFTYKDFLNIGLEGTYQYNIINMKEYQITEKLTNVFNNWTKEWKS